MTTVTPTRHNPIPLHTIRLSAKSNLSPIIDPPHPEPSHLPEPGHVHQHESAPFTEDAKIQDGGKARLVFVGTATCVLEWQGIRIMTDPNFLHAGEHVHLGPLVTSTRLINPAFPLSSLPPVHCVVLSHFHADHFDQEVERRLRRDLVVVTTRHAERELKAVQRPDGGFTRVYGMDVWESTLLELKETLSTREPVVRVVATPGKHVAGVVGAVNDAILHAIPPTNGHILELGYKSATGKEREEGEGQAVQVGYRIYISGDTLMVDDLKEIPKRYPDVDLLLIHLGGTSIPSAKAPLLMVTMDGKQGIELVRLIGPKLTIPIHFDDYDVFASPRSDFEKEMKEAGLEGKAVYLERGEAFDFGVRG